MPTKQSKAKATVHSTPPGAVKVGKRWIVPLEEMKGKGFLRLEANAIIKEVLANKHDYLNDKERAVRLCVNASTVCRWRKRVTAGQDPVQPPAGGTPPVNRHDIDADIKSITDADGDLSACEIRDKLAHDFGKVVCPQTVRNHLDDMGLTFKKFRRVPAMASLIPDWPSHSPDLNPIENIFTQVKDRIGKELQIYDMKNKEQSQKKISAKRDQVVQGMSDVCAQFVESFPRRLEKCADTGGNHTGY